MALRPTSANFLQHALRGHLQFILWKVASPAVSVNITEFGWEIQNGIPVPVKATGEPASPELGNVIRCQCRVEGKKCSTVSRICH